jgi:hypothetical protein
VSDCCRGGHFECVRALVGYNADVNNTTKENYSPLWEGMLTVLYPTKALTHSKWPPLAASNSAVSSSNVFHSGSTFSIKIVKEINNT